MASGNGGGSDSRLAQGHNLTSVSRRSNSLAGIVAGRPRPTHYRHDAPWHGWLRYAAASGAKESKISHLGAFWVRYGNASSPVGRPRPQGHLPAKALEGGRVPSALAHYPWPHRQSLMAS